VLAQGSNFYPYGSASAGFGSSSELLESARESIFGKLRVSYSSVGNDNVTAYFADDNRFVLGYQLSLMGVIRGFPAKHDAG